MFLVNAFEISMVYLKILCFNNRMRIQSIQSTNFKNTAPAQEPKKREFIDKLMGVVQNQRDDGIWERTFCRFSDRLEADNTFSASLA